MSWVNQTLVKKLNALATGYVDAYTSQKAHLPICDKDLEWVSICEQGKHDDTSNYWKPATAPEELTFENVEEALELKLHSDIKTYFTTLFSDQLLVKCSEGELLLLFAWNLDDFERLQENIIGHVLMKQKLKQAVTLFFAITDDDDYILSLNNDSGEVWVERVGCEPHKKLANTLSEFIATLSPIIPE